MELSPHFLSSSIALLLAFLFISLLLIWQSTTRKRARLPPGPPALPIVGNLLHLLRGGAPHRSLANLACRYGPFVHLQLGSMPTVVVSSPELAREVLATHDKIFASRPHIENGSRLSYGQDGGVALRSYGGQWRELRRLYSQQLFTARRLKENKPVIMDEMKEMMREIRGYAATGEAYDVTRGVGTLMENIICRILMGKRLEEVTSIRLGKNLKQVVNEGTELFAIPIVGDLIPWLSFLDVKATRRMDVWHVAVDELLEDVLTARDKALCAASTPDDEGPSLHNHKDFLDVLLSNHLPRVQVKAIMLELLVAGIDTSSKSLDWAMAELLSNQQVVNKLEEELDRVVGDSPSRMVEEEDLDHLVYAKAILKESMRLHPPAPLLVPHMSMESCEIGRYSLPKGTRVLVNAWSMGRDAQVWDDAYKFWPERFLGCKCEQVDLQGKHFELLPFGSGRRICPGMPLALLIIQTTLANLVHSFHWCLPPPPNHIVDMSEKHGSVVSRAQPLMAIPSLRYPS